MYLSGIRRLATAVPGGYMAAMHGDAWGVTGDGIGLKGRGGGASFSNFILYPGTN